MKAHNFNKIFNLQKHFNDLSFLHNYVHTKGYKFSNKFGLFPKTNYQTFKENVLIKWFDTYEKIIVLVVTLHMLKYPISVIEFDWSKKIGIDNCFPVLEIFEIEKIKNLLPEECLAEIRKIAENDTDTQNLYNYICELPDMSEEEQELQIFEFDKMTLEHGEGFIEWEKQEIKLMEECSAKEKKRILSRIEILRKWAIENNMMKPKMERAP